MGERKPDKANDGGDEPPTIGDMADEAQKQMPGKPPNLAFDPSKRNEELARAAGDRALAEAEEKLRRKRRSSRRARQSAFITASALDTSKLPGFSTFSVLTTPLSTTIA